MTLNNKRILLIISGGIAAYKSLELIRLIKKSGGEVQCILTKGGEQFVTPLSVSALSENKCYTDLWDLTDESEMGHIRLSRESDLVVVAPASADIIAKIAHGMANDLATTCLLATDKPVMVVPAMNPYMWLNQATQQNIKTLESRNIGIIGPEVGEMACGETGAGRMVEAQEIFKSIVGFFSSNKPLNGRKAIITAGPTYEPIDPVRFIGNRSSGKQGYAIAESLRDFGADVTLVSGPTSLPNPSGMTVIRIEKAVEMMDVVNEIMPADIVVCAAAVADYGVDPSPRKQKKTSDKKGLDIRFTDNPDILRTISNHKNRPEIVVGFAAETDNVIDNAEAKLHSKNCDAIVANQVGKGRVFDQMETSIVMITAQSSQSYENISKADVGHLISEFCANRLKN